MSFPHAFSGNPGDGQLHCNRLTYLSIRKVAEGLPCKGKCKLVKIEAIIKPLKLDKAREKLNEMGVNGMTATEQNTCNR